MISFVAKKSDMWQFFVCRQY